MPRAKFRIRVPEGLWIGELSRRYSDTRFQILAALADEETGVGLVRIYSDQTSQVLEDIRETEEVVTLDIVHKEESEALVQFETSKPLLLMPVQSSRIPLEMPFDLIDGEVVWDITASHERLSELGTQLSEFEIPYSLDKISQDIESTRLLTPRQETILEAAAEKGYYDTPRECTLTEIAADLDLAKSTCSDILHRAEGKLVKKFLGRV